MRNLNSFALFFILHVPKFQTINMIACVYTHLKLSMCKHECFNHNSLITQLFPGPYSIPQEMYIQLLSPLLSLQSVLHVDVRQRQLDCVSNVRTVQSAVPFPFLRGSNPGTPFQWPESRFKLGRNSQCHQVGRFPQQVGSKGQITNLPLRWGQSVHYLEYHPL